jgi:diguanylate cyclase (GGDEF)-like protein/PAS domain S-box-containing protein
VSFYRNPSLQVRILSLVTAGVVLCGLLFVAWRHHQDTQIKAILVTVREERNRIFAEAIKTYNQPLYSYINTNSYWDELVQFTKTRDRRRISENLDVQTEKSIDCVYVIDKSFNTSFFYTNTKENIDVNWKRYLKNRSHLRHTFSFFLVAPGNDIWEFFVAPISHGNDPQHKGETFGHLAAGRRWSKARLEELERITGARLQLTIEAPRRNVHPTPIPGQIRTEIILNAESVESPHIRLSADFDITLANQLNQFSDETLALFLGSGLLLILAIALSLMHWVNAPLRMLTQSLQGITPPPTNLPGREFRELGQLIRVFYENKQALRRANEELEQRVEERTAALQETVASLQETQQRFQEVIDHTPVTLFVLDKEGALLRLEGQGVRAANLPRERLLGRSAYRLWGNNNVVKQHIRNVLEHGVEQAYTVEVRRTPFEVRLRPLRDADGTVVGAIGVALDITERHRFEAILRHQALYDALTGLPNRTHLRSELDRALREAKEKRNTTAILFIDLDNFKLINDTLGHEIGDAVLRELAGRLQDAAGPRGLVARLAGDEFVILVEDVGGREAVEALGRKLSAALSAPLRIAGRELFTHGSIGIALASPGEATSTEILRHADVAMYKAKQSGRGRWFTFDESISQNLQERLELESDLRHAATRGELVAFYQPIVRLTDGVIEEVEALLRWNHPRLGLISPGRFIQIAEECGAIIGLDYWTLRQSCEEIAAYNATNPAQQLTVSVNLSVTQLQQPQLAQVVQKVLESSRLCPARLKLEITEGTMMQNPQGAAQVLQDLKSLGIRIAIDDFGTGFSSMAYLASLPLDTLKIDQSFIRQMNERTSSLAIVYAIRQLAAALDMDITCEGVETADQARLLRNMGCERAQGFLYGRPVPFSSLDVARPVTLPKAA